MKNLLNKEIKLAASPLSFLFIAFGAMAIIPGYPILVGAFFICFGLFHSFQSARENNDILYTVLLPVKKADAVKAKYVLAIFVQMCGFALMLILTMIRMTVMKNMTPYVNNAMMNANQAFLAYSLLIFAVFNLVFIAGFFKTAYYFSKPFIIYGIITLLIIGIGETLHHIPGLTQLNSTSPLSVVPMWLMLLAAVIIYIIMTLAGYKLSVKRFNEVDM